MKGTTFMLGADEQSEKEIEYDSPTGNEFRVRYTLHEGIDKDAITIRVEYDTRPVGIRLYTRDGTPIQDGEEVPLTELADVSSFRSSDTYEKGAMLFSFDVTHDHEPALDWDTVRFTPLLNGVEAQRGAFTRLFGGYPGISEDYDPEQGEFDHEVR